ncbi:MAG: ABC transporter permease [Nitrospinaceae bacterium]|jgi:putative ABC transport system permease protein|nr:ABC transporter permease [Nitrospinaceae bacterium]MBT3432971.1 ABC transporter permease [Nitrospinaceae bacterium]MBT3819813.1 ABC transporter permease [Nitrospinaceae bacterium]MBT4094750.1 ABC transporter permease [Nitrospinaceae bacterium]MBT4429859.1 ABC transporter permease [Nitrospinaceae bacterium]
MRNLFKIAIRNLLRFRRRTLLTASLICIGVVFVLVFNSVTGSFKNLMIGQITDSFLGDVQIHRRGYVASMDNLPLTMNLTGQELTLIEKAIAENKAIASYSERIKFGGLFSNFNESTNIRINGVDPEKEFATVPMLLSRIIKKKKDPSPTKTSLMKGSILVPELLARGLKLKVGDTTVVVATNKDGSVNGKTFKISGIMESATGPGGRDGYIHIADAREILRLRKKEVSEIALNLKNLGQAKQVANVLRTSLAGVLNKKGKPKFEVHPWPKLSPFANIAKMIDVITFFIRLILIAVVLISILNVMMMSVYERVREIGTISAIGTPPRTILSLFLIEGLCMGIFGAIVGVVLGGGTIFALNLIEIPFEFGRGGSFILTPSIHPLEVILVSGLVIVISVLASLQPAYKASRMEPIDALRHV